VSELNKAVVRRFHEEVAAGGDLALIDHLLAPDYISRADFPGIRPGREGVRQFFTMMHRAFAEFRVVINEQLAEGSKVFTWKTFHGKHVGEFLGVPPTGVTVAFDVMDILEVVDGKIVAHWNVVDVAGLLQQLQSVPA